MKRPRDMRLRPWQTVIAAVAGLLLVVALAGFSGFVLNQRISEVTREVIRYDVELQAEGDELRAATLDLRHYHRNILFGGPTSSNVEDFEIAYARLHGEIDELEQLGVRSSDVPSPDQLREMARDYYDDFRPAVDLYDSEPEAFARASDAGLAELDGMESEAQTIDDRGEQHAQQALSDVERVTDTANLVLISVLAGLALVGALLAYAAVRMVSELRDLYAREQRAAEDLAESEERFRALLKNSSDIISVFEKDGKVVYHSPSHQRILGHKPEERVGQSIFTVPHVHPDDLAAKRSFFDRILASEPGELQTARFRLRDVEDTYHVMEAVGANRLDDPLVRGIVTNYRDVTERYHAEEALRFQKALLESQSEASIDGILVVSGRQEVLSFNRRFVEMWQVPEEIMASGQAGEVLREIQNKVEQPEEYRRLVQYLYEHPDEESQSELPLADGRTFDCYSAPVKGADGAYYGRVWHVRDITGRKQAEEQLRQYAALLDLSYEPILVWDLEQGIVEWNKGCERLYGYTKAEAAGQISHRLLKTVHPINVDELKDTLLRDGVWSDEVRHTTRCGREVIVETSHQLIESQGRRLVLETNRDITERKRIEQELERSLESKTEFLADVSHELRTPLTVVRSNAEVGLELQRGCVHSEILQEIARESRSMSRLVEDLLFIARSDAGSLPLEPETLEAKAFLSSLAERAGTLAKENGATLETELSASGKLRVDPARIEQAVLVLVDNAAKYAADGGEITLASRTEAGELRLEVADRGPGIPEEYLSRIFERFYRPESEPGKRGGAGLGLPIASKIAELHGGRVEASRREGGGTIMTLYLPLADAPGISRKDLEVQRL